MGQNKFLVSATAFALAAGAALVATVSAGAPASAAQTCTITSQVLSGRNYNVAASTYCANGYQFRAVQKYVDSGGGIKTAYGAWKSVATSTATRPVNTLYNSGTYQIG
jgi:hypothetical protein